MWSRSLMSIMGVRAVLLAHPEGDRLWVLCGSWNAQGRALSDHSDNLDSTRPDADAACP
jgi:hypothetical protein